MTKSILKNTCLFVYTSPGPFVINDRTYLSRYCTIVEYHFQLSKSVFALTWRLLHFSKFLLFNMHKINFVFTWFADYHSPILALFSKLYRKPVYSVIGGYEVESLPQFGYGGIKNPFRKMAIQYSLNRATLLLPVSDYSKKRTMKLINHNRIETIYNGIQIRHNPKQKQTEENVFLTVAQIEREQNLYIKGIPRFFQMARAFPQNTFILVGGSRDLIQSFLGEIPPNVQLFEATSSDELDLHYQNAKYYVQLSEVESFGVAVLEALSWGNIPIVSNRGALPEIYGHIGIVIDIDEFDTELENLPLRLKIDYDYKKMQQFVSRFDITHRHQKLSELLFKG